MGVNRGFTRGDQESASDGKISEGRRSQLPPIQEPRTSLRSYPTQESGRRIMFPPQMEARKPHPPQDPRKLVPSQGMLPKVQGPNRGNSRIKGFVPGLTIRDPERQPIKEELSYLDKAMGKPASIFPDVKDSQGIATRHMQRIKLKPKELITIDVLDHKETQPENRFELPSIAGQANKVSPRSHEGTPKPQGHKLQTPTKGDTRAGGQKLTFVKGNRPGTCKGHRANQNQ